MIDKLQNLIPLARQYYPILRPALPHLHAAYNLLPIEDRSDILARVSNLAEVAQTSPLGAVAQLVDLYEAIPESVRPGVCNCIDQAVMEFLNSGE